MELLERFGSIGPPIVGTSKGKGAGVFGITDDGNGIEGHSTNQIGVFGKGGRLAALFDGDVEVTGDIRLSNADCAEDFGMDVDAIVEPGTVMVIPDEGVLRHSERVLTRRSRASSQALEVTSPA